MARRNAIRLSGEGYASETHAAPMRAARFLSISSVRRRVRAVRLRAGRFAARDAGVAQRVRSTWARARTLPAETYGRARERRGLPRARHGDAGVREPFQGEDRG